MESTVTSVDINKTGKYLTEYFVIPGLPELTNLLEDTLEEIPLKDGAAVLSFRPFEIKTVKFVK